MSRCILQERLTKTTKVLEPSNNVCVHSFLIFLVVKRSTYDIIDNFGNRIGIQITLLPLKNIAEFTIIGRKNSWIYFGLGSHNFSNADAYILSKPDGERPCQKN